MVEKDMSKDIEQMMKREFGYYRYKQNDHISGYIRIDERPSNEFEHPDQRRYNLPYTVFVVNDDDGKTQTEIGTAIFCDPNAGSLTPTTGLYYTFYPIKEIGITVKGYSVPTSKLKEITAQEFYAAAIGVPLVNEQPS